MKLKNKTIQELCSSIADLLFFTSSNCGGQILNQCEFVRQWVSQTLLRLPLGDGGSLVAHLFFGGTFVHDGGHGDSYVLRVFFKDKWVVALEGGKWFLLASLFCKPFFTTNNHPLVGKETQHKRNPTVTTCLIMLYLLYYLTESHDTGIN